MDYKQKYYKYKIKYIKLRNNKRHNIINEMYGGGKYDCDPSKTFKELCFEKENGKYKSRESCINDCENKYITHNLIKINIKGESLKFQLFIKDIIQNEKIDVYIKGGNVIGLKLLKMIYEKYKQNDKEFRNVFNKFLELELIKDWDFAGYTKNQIDNSYREKLDKTAEKYKLVPRAKTFILYQTKRPILTDGKPMFEIALLDTDSFSKMEIPLTTMKMKVTEYNIKYIFMYCKSFIANKDKNEEFDFDILKRMIDKTDIIFYPHKNGLYEVTPKTFDKGDLNDDLINFIKTFDDFDKNMPQFLATHIEDPFRILYRLPEKNIKKNDKIKDFIKKYITKEPQTWLFDSTFITKILKIFMEQLGNKLYNIYMENYENTTNRQESLEICLKFLDGINFNRVQTDFKLLTEFGLNLLDLLFGKLINKIEKINLSGLKNTNKTIGFIKFLSENN